jgi:mRNA-degrading endonuclease HigB of HigAB toxin-antitoxin module
MKAFRFLASKASHQSVDIKNNEARLISYIDYKMGTVTVLAVLTRKEYDKGGWKSACNC